MAVRILIISILFMTSIYRVVQAQEDQIVRNTGNTDPNSKKSDKHSLKSQKNLMSIIKSDTRGILYGNKCLEQVLYEMGFEYVVIPKGNPGNQTELGRNFHNLGVKIALFFTRGPFWKLKLKKKMKECRYKMGDYNG